MRVVQFKENELKDLAIFLERVELKGIQEAAALVQIGARLNEEALTKLKKEDGNNKS